jgi:hypothetical protein
MNRIDRLGSSPNTSVRAHGTNGRRAMRRRAHGALLLLSLALLAAVMALAGYRLFHGITRVGMTGVDNFDYWRIADELLHGRYDTDYHRLSFYALNALALKVLGANDYAIRAFVDGFAVLNIALVYLLAQRVAGNAAIALVAAALYAFNPTVLLYTGTELPHVTGATFVLFAALLAPRAADPTTDLRRRAAASFLMGVSVTAAVLTHEDLAFLGIGYLIVLALPLTVSALPPAPAARGRGVALNAGAFVFGTLAAAACLMIGFGVTPWKMLHDFLLVREEFDANTAVRTGGEFFATVPVRMLRNFTVDTMGRTVTALAALVAVIAPIAFAMRRCEWLKLLLMVEIPILAYIAGFLGVAQIYLEGTYQRLFIPLIGPTLVLAVGGAYLLLRPLLRWGAAVLIVTWAAYVVVGNRPWNFPSPGVNGYRQLYDAVKDRVTPERKLLLPACYAIGYPWVGVGSPVYLDGNAVSIYLLRDFVSLDALIAANHVGYVYVATTPLPGMWPRERIERLFRETYGAPMDRALLDALPRVSQQVWRGDARVEWTGAACAYEAESLRRLLEARGARVALTIPGMGDIYQLAR